MTVEAQDQVDQGKPAGPALEGELGLGLPPDEMARRLDLTPRRLQMLAAEGVLPRVGRGRYPEHETTVAYIRHLRQQASGQSGQLQTERATLTKLQADKLRLDTEERLGQLIPAEDLRTVLQAAFGNCRARLLSLPARLAPLLEGLAVGEIRQQLTEAIKDVCAELSATRVEPDPAGQPDRGGNGDASIPGMDAATRPDR